MLNVASIEVGGSAYLLATTEELVEGQGVELTVDAGSLSSPGYKGAAYTSAVVRVTQGHAVGLGRHVKLCVCGVLALGTGHLQVGFKNNTVNILARPLDKCLVLALLL